MSLTLPWRDRAEPVELVTSLLDGSQLLDAFHAFIVDRFEPSEVFGEAELKKYISDNFDPEDVFSPSQLKAWAEENGFEENA